VRPTSANRDTASPSDIPTSCGIRSVPGSVTAVWVDGDVVVSEASAGGGPVRPCANHTPTAPPSTARTNIMAATPNHFRRFGAASGDAESGGGATGVLSTV